MADVGARCVVGAGSIVHRPVRDDTVVAGNPARLIRGTTDA
jgi:acetyltransferase-like isoleucine patch superfamily enzyme